MIVLVVKIRSESGMHIKVLINMTLILFILAVFGASFIVTQSFLFERIRNLFNKYRYIIVSRNRKRATSASFFI